MTIRLCSIVREERPSRLSSRASDRRAVFAGLDAYEAAGGKVLRDLFVLKGDKELSFGERKMLDTARNLLVKELSIARAHPEEKIMEELKSIFAH